MICILSPHSVITCCAWQCSDLSRMHVSYTVIPSQTCLSGHLSIAVTCFTSLKIPPPQKKRRRSYCVKDPVNSSHFFCFPYLALSGCMLLAGLTIVCFKHMVQPSLHYNILDSTCILTTCSGYKLNGPNSRRLTIFKSMVYSNPLTKISVK